MTSTPITLKFKPGRVANTYECDITAQQSRLCVAASFEHYGQLTAYLLDSNVPKPVSLGFDKGPTPSLWLNVITGMRLRIVADSQPEAVTLITED